MAEQLTPPEKAAVNQSENNASEAHDLAKELENDLAERTYQTGQLEGSEVSLAGLGRELESNQAHEANLREQSGEVLVSIAAKKAALEARLASMEQDSEEYRDAQRNGPDYSLVEQPVVDELGRIESEREKLTRGIESYRKRIEQSRPDVAGAEAKLQVAQSREAANRRLGEQISADTLPQLRSAAEKMMQNDFAARDSKIRDNNERDNRYQRREVDALENQRKEQAEQAAKHQDVLEAEARKMMDSEFAKRPDDTDSPKTVEFS